jgi:hypothetical protein
MPQSFSIASPASSQDESHWIQREIGQLRWWVARDWADLLESEPTAWFHLEGDPRATPIKKNAIREVHRMLINGQGIYAKSYQPLGVIDSAKSLFRGPACQMEWRVAQYAQAHGIDAIRPVGFASRMSWLRNGAGVLLTEELRNAVPLNEGWDALLKDPDRRSRFRTLNALVDSTAKLIAHAHQCGFEHADMHAGNMVVQTDDPSNPRVLFVDLQKAHIGRPVTDDSIVRNLAQLNQWFRRHASLTQRFRFLRMYLSHHRRLATQSPFSRRTHLTLKPLAAALQAQADQHARKLWSKRDRRSLRKGKYFSKITLHGGWRGHVFLNCKQPLPESPASGFQLRSGQWTRWLSDPQQLFCPSDPKALLKESHTALVTRVHLEDETTSIGAVCKRPLARNWAKRIGSLFRSSRAHRTWRYGNALLHRNLPTARPLAAFERRILGCRVDSFVLTEYLKDTLPLPDYIQRHIGDLPVREAHVGKQQLSTALSKLTKRLIACRFHHRDFKAENILVQVASPNVLPNLFLIDMDGLNHHPHRDTTQEEIRKMLARLSHNLEETTSLSRADRLRFLKCFLTGPGKSTLGWKAIWSDVSVLVLQKRKRKARRTAWKLVHYGRK